MYYIHTSDQQNKVTYHVEGR